MFFKIILSTLFLFCYYPIFTQTTIAYTSDSSDFPNPERGFTYPFEINIDNIVSFDENEIAFIRQYHLSDRESGEYYVYSTVISLEISLKEYVDKPIEHWYLNKMQNVFNVCRDAGIKIDLQYTYTNGSNNDCFNNNDYFCPPYKDASKSVVLMHINQLKPLWNENTDVINNLSLGFIGIYGETYYTDYFGGTNLPMQAENWQDRNEVIKAMLEALPKCRMVSIRYPQQIQKFQFGENSPVTSPALSLQEAYTGTDFSRLAFYNDCFLSDYTDVGTYYNFDNNTEDTTNLRPFTQQHSKYVMVSGETCKDYNPWDNCSNDPYNPGMADVEMKKFHWSLLNSAFYNGMNNGWINICLDEIKRKLGYRFVLIDGTYTDIAAQNETIDIKIRLYNEGFASPFNPRDVEIILRNTSNTDLKYRAKLNQNPQFWFSEDTITIEQTLCLPPDIPIGDYEVLLNLPDPFESINNRPEYSIRLANTNVWEAQTGFNKLNHILQITSLTSNSTCNNQTIFELKIDKHENNNIEISQLKVFPNPNNGEFLLNFDSNLNGVTHIAINNLLGEIVYSNDITAIKGRNVKQLNLVNISNGVYILKIQSNNGFQFIKMIVD